MKRLFSNQVYRAESSWQDEYKILAGPLDLVNRGRDVHWDLSYFPFELYGSFGHFTGKGWEGMG